MVPVVFLQEDENAPRVYRNLKICCETTPKSLRVGRPNGRACICASLEFILRDFTRFTPSLSRLVQKELSLVFDPMVYGDLRLLQITVI